MVPIAPEKKGKNFVLSRISLGMDVVEEGVMNDLLLLVVGHKVSQGEF